MSIWDASLLAIPSPAFTLKNTSGAPNYWPFPPPQPFRTPGSMKLHASTERRLSRGSTVSRMPRSLWRNRRTAASSSEEKFQKVFRSSPIPFSITTLKDGRFLDVNAAFERRYGYSRVEVLGHTVHELAIWEDPRDRELMLAQLSKGGPIQNVMTRLRTKSGEIKVTAYSADRIQFEGESCILAVSEDVPQIDPHKSN